MVCRLSNAYLLREFLQQWHPLWFPNLQYNSFSMMVSGFFGGISVHNVLQSLKGAQVLSRFSPQELGSLVKKSFCHQQMKRLLLLQYDKTKRFLPHRYEWALTLWSKECIWCLKWFLKSLQNTVVCLAIIHLLRLQQPDQHRVVSPRNPQLEPV